MQVIIKIICPPGEERSPTRLNCNCNNVMSILNLNLMFGCKDIKNILFLRGELVNQLGLTLGMYCDCSGKFRPHFFL